MAASPTPFARPLYTPSQLSQFLHQIPVPPLLRDHLCSPSFVPDLASLTTLQACTVASVAFESLALHYSTYHSINLDPAALYDKIVTAGNGRGGYCMEVSTFFATVLRSLGYECWSAGARVAEHGPEEGTEGEPREGVRYKGWCHMVNIVTISSQRYLVDVGFGASGPHHPIPLLPQGIEELNVGMQYLSLSHEPIPDCLDRSQRFWVYRFRHTAESPWVTGYCFTEVEFLPGDFEIMNLGTSRGPGLFTENVLCVKMVMEKEGVEGEERVRLVGDVTLFGGEVKRRIGGVKEVVQVLRSEEERVQALERWLDVRLTDEERMGIRGMPSELK